MLLGDSHTHCKSPDWLIEIPLAHQTRKLGGKTLVDDGNRVVPREMTPGNLTPGKEQKLKQQQNCPIGQSKSHRGTSSPMLLYCFPLNASYLHFPQLLV